MKTCTIVFAGLFLVLAPATPAAQKNPDGAKIFEEKCAVCHRSVQQTRAPSREVMGELSRERIQMYDRRVNEAVESVRETYPRAERDESLWPAIKLAYIGLLHEHRQPECAETFYNSVACQVLHRRYYRNEFIFWRPAVATEHLEGEELGVEVEVATVRARAIGRAIVDRARDTGADVIVLGSSPRWRRQSRFFSPTVDYVLRKAPAEVLVVASRPVVVRLNDTAHLAGLEPAK